MNWRKLLHRNHSDADLSQEIRLHLAEEMEENVTRGMAPEEARRQAYIKFGSPQRVRETVWQQNSVAFTESLFRDLKYALRSLSRTPGFTLMALLVMALGIGANSAMFTVVRSVLFKPLPYKDAGRLVVLYQHDPSAKDQDNYVAPGNFSDWSQHARSFESMAMVTPWAAYDFSEKGGSYPEKIDAAWCSWNMFSILGVPPAYGRTFNALDDRPDANATVILSWGFWKRRLGGDPSIVGRAIFLRGLPYTVIGIMPAGFDYPEKQDQVWTPAHHEGSAHLLQSRDDHEYKVIARLRPRTTVAQSVSELDAIQKRIQEEFPGLPVEPGVNGRLLLDDLVGDYKTPLYTLLAATTCVLLIACLNVANLLVARASARRREVAIRSALGANRWRLIREQLAESFLLACAGGGIGVGLSSAALTWIRHVQQNMVRVDSISLDALALLFVMGVTLGSGLLAGIIPALAAGRPRTLEALQESSRSQSGGRSRARLRKALLAIEVGLTVVLLITAGLLLKSYERLRSVDMGCATGNVLTLQFSLPGPAQKRVAFLSELIERVRALPGVKAAGLVTAAPGTGWWEDTPVTVVEHPPAAKGAVLDPIARSADPDYFRAMQIPLLRGRTFSEAERLQNANVAIVSKRAAEEFFPGEDAIGKHLKLTQDPDTPPLEIIGIVGDTRFHISEDVWPMLYQPVYRGSFGQTTVMVRSDQDVENLARPIGQIISKMDPDLALGEALTMEQIIDRSTSSASFHSRLILIFAVIALISAMAGLYGVLAYLVTQRTSEIGIRMALGAQRHEVLRIMLIDGLWPAWIGLALGLAGASLTMQLVRKMLYDVQPLDWPVFAAVSLMLSLVAALACLIPAWQASRFAPMDALRLE
jgi:putative ABC transport system permease protein